MVSGGVTTRQRRAGDEIRIISDAISAPTKVYGLRLCVFLHFTDESRTGEMGGWRLGRLIDKRPVLKDGEFVECCDDPSRRKDTLMKASKRDERADRFRLQHEELIFAKAATLAGRQSCRAFYACITVSSSSRYDRVALHHRSPLHGRQRAAKT